jgi:hypothetical protein
VLGRSRLREEKVWAVHAISSGILQPPAPNLLTIIRSWPFPSSSTVAARVALVCYATCIQLSAQEVAYEKPIARKGIAFYAAGLEAIMTSLYSHVTLERSADVSDRKPELSAMRSSSARWQWGPIAQFNFIGERQQTAKSLAHAAAKNECKNGPPETMHP